MVKKEYIGKKEDGTEYRKTFEFNEVGYGQVLDIQDEATVIDSVTEVPKRLNGVFTRKFILAWAKLDGTPVDINNPEQVTYEEGAWLDKQAREYLSQIATKNTSGE